MSGKALLEHFSALEDPRQGWKVVYPLPEIMLLVLCGTLAAAEDFVEVRRWGQEKLEFLRTMLPFNNGIPSHNTLNDVLNALDPGLFSACFTAWVEALRTSFCSISWRSERTEKNACSRASNRSFSPASAASARIRIARSG